MPRRDPLAADPQQQDRPELADQQVPARVGRAPAGAARGEAEPAGGAPGAHPHGAEPALRRRDPVPVGLRERHGGVMARVVVGRALDVGQRALSERAERQPVVVVELLPGAPGRERQRGLEQLAPEQRGGAGDVVGDHHRGHARGVVAALEEVGLREDVAVGVGDPDVAVGEQRPRLGLEGAESGPRACRGPSGRPGRRARSDPPPPAPGRSPARSYGGSRAAPAERLTTKRSSPATWRSSSANALRRGAVVADHADPVSVRLLADRVELARRGGPRRARRSPCRSRPADRPSLPGAGSARGSGSGSSPATGPGTVTIVHQSSPAS